jgi:aminoglycoside phosphotransferase (APT) family kinase protein
LSVDPNAKRVVRVKVERLGGFEDKSFTLRYRLTLKMRSGRQRQMVLRGSCEVKDQTRRQAYVIMRYLWLHGFADGPSQVARPVTFFYHWKLLVYEECPGATLLTVLRRRGVKARPYLEHAAIWLAKLHTHSPRTLSLAYNQAGRKQYWQMALRLLSSAGQKESKLLRRNIERVMRLEDALAASAHRRLVHHDFHLNNILVTPDVVRAVDFTESRLSSPLVDVATFIAQLELLLYPSVSMSTIAAWQKIFLQAYHRKQPGIQLNTPAAKKIVRFIRFRIALQSFVAAYLFGRREGPLKEAALETSWYHG